MSLAFDKSTVVKEYKDEIEVLQKDKDVLAKKVGNLTIEKDFLVEKLASLASSKERKALLDTKLKLSLNKQCQLLHIAKSSLYYMPKKPFSTSGEIRLRYATNNIYSDFPSYGYRRLTKQLQNDGYNVGKKLVKKAMRYMGIEPCILSLRRLWRTKSIYKYPYLLKALQLHFLRAL